VHLALDRCVVRYWRPEDAPSLARHANDRRIWRYLRDRFPHPYTLDDALTYLARQTAEPSVGSLCIEVEGEAAGSVGLMLRRDVERFSAELGYWLGAAYWGRGIVTEAVEAVTRYAFETLGLERVFALPFAPNAASCRVLEKAGFTPEGRLRRSAFKEGQFLDQILYAKLRAMEDEE